MASTVTRFSSYLTMGVDEIIRAHSAAELVFLQRKIQTNAK
jgi:hypothetical protein